jgi:plasmid stabilization system protein ParE
MRGRRVVKLRRAEADVRIIATWLAERSRDGAARWLEALETALDRLSENAESCSEADEADVVPEHVLQRFFSGPGAAGHFAACSPSSATKCACCGFTVPARHR